MTFYYPTCAKTVNQFFLLEARIEQKEFAWKNSFAPNQIFNAILHSLFSAAA